MMKQGEWISQNPDANPKIQGYSINGLYSPVGWRSWAEQVKDFLKCKDDRFLLKAWTNSFGETWEEMGEGLQWEYIFTRREDYSDEELPSEDIVLITAGLTPKMTGLQFSFWDTPMIIRFIPFYQELYGDPGTQIHGMHWMKSWKESFKHLNGVELNVASAFIDSGGIMRMQFIDIVQVDPSKESTQSKVQTHLGNQSLTNYQTGKRVGVALFPGGGHCQRTDIFLSKE